MTDQNTKSAIRNIQPVLVNSTNRTALCLAELNMSDIKGMGVYGQDDKEIGNVSHVHGAGRNAQAVVDIGTFLGTGAKRVALDISSLNFIRDDNGTVHITTTMSKDQLQSLRRSWSGLMHLEAEAVYAAAMRKAEAA
ncbi:MAG: PRC-barrel domain-containing protein [Rhodobacterales bacterium]|nr:PRC-barrel domain-containing protein [Rhodobacterales bacterium]